MKWDYFEKVIKRDELCDFHVFVVFSRWNVHVYSTALMRSKCIHSWGIRICLLSFDSISTIDFKLKNGRRTLSKMTFKAEYPVNLLWLIWYDYMKICEWLIDVEYDVYHSMVDFNLYMNCKKLYKVVDL